LGEHVLRFGHVHIGMVVHDGETAAREQQKGYQQSFERGGDARWFGLARCYDACLRAVQG
jgi:DNA-binding LacI/PurR family transcriptional regulator